VISSISGSDYCFRCSAWRRWSTVVSVSVIFVVAAIVSLNVLVDPFSVFGVNSGRHGFTPNERYNKVEFLLSHSSDFDSFILGSSRMGVFDPDALESLRPGRSYYNLGLFAGTPNDAYRILSTLIDRGVSVKEVLLGLDVFPFTEASSITDPATRHHPTVLGVSEVSYLSSYLFIPSFLPSLSRLLHQRSELPDIEFDFQGSGRYILSKYDRLIALDHPAYVSSRFSSGGLPLSGSLLWVDQRFDELARLIDFLSRNQVEAFVFIHPQHHAQMSTISERDYGEFLSRVQRIVPSVVDFNCFPSITQDDSLYYDIKHYRAPVADFVLEVLMQGEGRVYSRLCHGAPTSVSATAQSTQGR
jgi:hypothetical protein